MRRTIPLAAVLVATLALTACGGDPEPAASSASRPTASSSASPSPSASPSAGAAGAGGLYVALGDSLAAGYQPGGAELRDTAYPALTATRLGPAGDALTLENLGCSGETTTSLVKGGKCDFAAGSQLEQAEKLLEAATTSRSSRSTSAATTCCAACGAGRRSTPRASPRASAR